MDANDLDDVYDADDERILDQMRLSRFLQQGIGDMSSLSRDGNGRPSFGNDSTAEKTNKGLSAVSLSTGTIQERRSSPSREELQKFIFQQGNELDRMKRMLDQQQYVNTVDTDMKLKSIEFPQGNKVHSNSNQLQSLRQRIHKLRQMEAKMMEDEQRETLFYNNQSPSQPSTPNQFETLMHQLKVMSEEVNNLKNRLDTIPNSGNDSSS